jgi:hypothetical protein
MSASTSLPFEEPISFQFTPSMNGRYTWVMEVSSAFCVYPNVLGDEVKQCEEGV